ncbi:MAG: polyphosphate kinase 2 family protein, partial [Verrucomicrobiota bacterium]|nr:polyphosphate kinase 2 family protein [Verrucomicrobiota bacterium]
RFLDRLEEPEKNWKFSVADLAERDLWDDYMAAYEACLRATSTREAPWFAVPADDKKNARLIIADAIVDALKELKMSYPQPDLAQRKELEKIRKTLSDEKS